MTRFIDPKLLVVVINALVVLCNLHYDLFLSDVDLGSIALVSIVYIVVQGAREIYRTKEDRDLGY